MSDTIPKLLPKHKLFAEKYVKGISAVQAAIEAGYSENYANAQSTKLLQKKGIREYIALLQEEIKNENIADAREIQEFLTKQMRGEDDEECVVVEGVGDGCSEARVVTKKITPRDKAKAAEILAKINGLFTDGGGNFMPVQINFVNEYH